VTTDAEQSHGEGGERQATASSEHDDHGGRLRRSDPTAHLHAVQIGSPTNGSATTFPSAAAVHGPRAASGICLALISDWPGDGGAGHSMGGSTTEGDIPWSPP
jgi:hypothetical protein